MATKSKFKSDVFEAIHSSAAMLHKVGAMDKTTMLDFATLIMYLVFGFAHGGNSPEMRRPSPLNPPGTVTVGTRNRVR